MACRGHAGDRRRSAGADLRAVVWLSLERSRDGPRALVSRGPPSCRRRSRQPVGLPRRRPRLGRRAHPARHRDAVPRSGRDHLAQHRRPRGGRPAQRAIEGSQDDRRPRRAARAAGQHAGDGAAADPRRSRRAAPPRTVPGRCMARSHVPRHVLRAIRVVVPRAPERAVRGRAVHRRRRRCRDDDRVAHPPGDGHGARHRDVQRLPVDDSRAQQPCVPPDRARRCSR